MKAFYYHIEPYKIKASGMQLTVLPMDDGVYRVCYENKVLADLILRLLPQEFFGMAMASFRYGLRKKSASKSTPVKSKIRIKMVF